MHCSRVDVPEVWSILSPVIFKGTGSALMSDAKEKVKETIDDAAAAAKKATDKAAEKGSEAAKRTGEAVEKAGERIKDAGK
jgi:hypothetical protein